jgi:hypothetical protein
MSWFALNSNSHFLESTRGYQRNFHSILAMAQVMVYVPSQDSVDSAPE